MSSKSLVKILTPSGDSQFGSSTECATNSNHLSVMLSWDTVIMSSGPALLASHLLVYHAMSLVVG